MTTCLHSLSEHPNFSEIKFIIHPFLAGQFAGFMDVPAMSLEKVRSKYEEKYGVEIEVVEEEINFKDWRKGLKSLGLSKKKKEHIEFLEKMTELFTNPDFYYVNFFSEQMQKDILKYLFQN
eukprot:CAMPEP_0205805488 /NCGR_PEP_ID=MMETSP0205-20121125/8734_1 /ASSEMBLY_ACC=CAM_ASM_000278 /TAXON_ID=36767 /ORGANISM="Euplotes focardii, Strain TN1" /LENGTH=120 /DNA_ID=CAMNT_0053076801 /DNA_START=159 /DNA_END=521 /DNA_ORIENTATION=-